LKSHPDVELMAAAVKNFAAVEGGRNGGLNHPALIGDFSRGGIKAVTVSLEYEAVVGDDESCLLFVLTMMALR